jgi:heme-degrading monooxygenase HmoA
MTGSSTNPAVTVVVTRVVRPGTEEQFAHWADDIDQAAARFPGHFAGGRLHDNQGLNHLIYRLDSAEHLRAWENSAERRALIRQGDQISDQTTSTNRDPDPWSAPDAIPPCQPPNVGNRVPGDFGYPHPRVGQTGWHRKHGPRRCRRPLVWVRDMRCGKTLSNRGGRRAMIVAREQATVDRVVSLVREEGLDIMGTTSDEEALGRLESGAVGGLVIGGGVQEESRQRLRSVADQKGIAVVRGALAGKDPGVCVRDELVPQLRQIIR